MITAETLRRRVHRVAEGLHKDITSRVIAAAIEVHRNLGPGLFESVYEECLCQELRLRGVAHRRQVNLPVLYKGVALDCAYRLDLVVEDKVVVELKAIEHILPVHKAQLLTYLKLTNLHVGLLINFNVPLLADGIIRQVW